MKRVKYFFRLVFRFIVLWLVDVISLWITSLLTPGIRIEAVSGTPSVVVAVSAALLLGIINLVVRPVILLLALPFGFFVLFIIGFFVNAIALYITAALLPGFSVSGWFAAFFGGLILALINTIITSVISIDDDDQFYQGLVERIAARQSFKYKNTAGKGLILLEIDGLSYWHMQKVIDEDWMPTITRLIEENDYKLSRVDCGLPSQTSAAQAGIFYGDNFDIPAYRWYDKSESRMIVSGRDAALLNERYSNGRGLLRGGSSINNMLDGDAEKSLLTLANLRGDSPDERWRRAQDMYLLLLNPYFLMRTLILFVWDILIELWQYLRTSLSGEWPRLNRLANFYPVLRASANVLSRDIASYLLVLDIIRGSPAIYMTWPGYDEVAHHSGPWSKDAFGVLRKFDHVIARALDIATRKAPIPYELIILSDHGQSYGATFQQRYGITLREFIEQNLPAGTQVSLSSGGDDGTLSIKAISGEIENIQQQGVGGRVGQSVVRQTNRVLAKGTAQQDAEDSREASEVIVCGSGNLAQVYFDLLPKRLTLTELNSIYPGMVDALIEHQGIGFVVGYEDPDTPVVLSRTGKRNLITGVIRGDDPLASYGDSELRAAQVMKLASFPNTGDLIVNSTVYTDGTVAAMEELIGNHGGLGGEQTDAFLFHRPDLIVPPTQDATDLFRILNPRRIQPHSIEPQLETAEKIRVDEWAPKILLEGLGRYDSWLTLASHALWLNRDAYQAIVQDPYMTSPSILIVLVVSILISALDGPETFFQNVGVRFAIWPVITLILYGAGRLLGGRGSYTKTLRATGFAQIGNIVQLLALIRPLAPIAQTAAFALTFIGTWIGANEAQTIKDWRGWVIPVVALLVLIGGLIVIGVLISGTAFTMDMLLGDFLSTP